MYKVLFYRRNNDSVPTVEFKRSFPDNVIGKIDKWIERLQEHGPNLRRPIVDKIADKIYELRLSFGHLSPRFLFFYYGKYIIITHGFLKKTREIPRSEIERATEYMHDFLRQQGDIS